MSATTVVSIDKVVEAYIATRDLIAETKKRHKRELEQLEQLQERREQWLAQQLNMFEQQGLKPSIKTDFGNVFFTIKEFVQSEDWETTLKWIVDNQRWDFLTKNLSKQAVLDEMGEARDVTKVPGIKYTAVREVSVRRS